MFLEGLPLKGSFERSEKKIPATKATGNKLILGYPLSNKRIYRCTNNSYNLNYGLV